MGSEPEKKGFGARAPKSNSDQVRDNIARAAAVFRHIPEAEAAVEGLPVDSYDLVAWLIEQDDPAWLKPSAMRRWAEIVAERGFETIAPAGAKLR